MQKLRMLALAFLVTTSVPLLNAQNVPKIAIEIVNRSDDSVGGRLILRIKEKLQVSNVFRLTTEPEIRIQIRIDSIDQDEKNAGVSSAYSIVWTYVAPNECPIPILLNNTIGICGSSRIDDVADRVLAATDKLIDTLRQMLPQPAQK